MALTQQAKPTRVEGDLLPDQVITFRAFSRNQMACKVCPLPTKESGGKHYTGQGETGFYEDMSDEDRKKLSYIITPNTYITVHLDKVMRGSSAKDFADWRWMRRHPYIALSFETGASSRDAVFYVFNEAIEAEERMKRKDVIIKATYKLRHECSVEKATLIAEALGFPEPRTAKPEVIGDWIVSKTEDPLTGLTTAMKVIAMLSDDEESRAMQRAMSLFAGLSRYKIIGKRRGGIYRWGDEEGKVLGGTEDAVVKYLTNPANSADIDALEMQLADARKVDATTIR